MFKWILIFIVTFCAAWIFVKERIPASVRDSGFGEYMNIFMFPLEYRANSGSFKGGKFGGIVADVNDVKLRSLMESASSRNTPVVVYFYTSKCILCRIALHNINEIAKTYAPSKKVLFFVVSFDEDIIRNKFLLDREETLYFRPFMTRPENIKTAQYFYQRHDIGFDETPVLLFKDRLGDYKNVGLEFNMRSDLETMIRGNL